jgi:hypothetical protein
LGLQQSCWPIRQAFATTLQRVVELGDGLNTFLESEGIEPSNNAAEREL